MFLLLPTLAAVALSTSADVTVRLMAITVLEVLRQYLLGPSGQVLMALLHFYAQP